MDSWGDQKDLVPAHYGSYRRGLMQGVVVGILVGLLLVAIGAGVSPF